MKRVRAKLLAAVSSVALVSPVVAADMPVKAHPPLVVAPSWAGPYIGASLGAVWHEVKFEELAFNAGIEPDGRRKPVGVIGGGHIGYNWQANSLVYGVEADISGASARVTFTPYPTVPALGTVSSRLQWLATFRARAGVTTGSTLFFATAGFALGGVENRRTFPPGGIIPAEIGEGKATRTGWVAGGGIEHVLNRNWIVRAEALYVDLGSETVNGPTSADTYVSRFTNTEVIARGAVLFKW